MSLHIFNSNNKSWKMYINTLSSISGDDLTIKPYDGKNISLEVSENNAIFIKKGDTSYNLSNLITGTGLGTSATIVRGSDASFTNIDVSGNLTPLNANGSSIGLATKTWKNAYISDLSVTSIDVSGNLNPLNANSSSLGTALKYWNNAYIRDVSVTNIDVTSNLNPLNANSSSLGSLVKSWANAYIRDVSVTNIDLSGNLNPLINNGSSLGSSTKIWKNAYINDISVSNIDVSGNLNPLNANNSSLGASTKYWRNAYIRDVSAIYIDVSGNLYPLISNSSSLGSSLKVWKTIYVDDLSINKINGTTYSAGAGGGGGSTDLTSISSNVIPSLNNTYNLGSTTKYWNNSYTTNLRVVNRAYQEISGDISWSAVNGYYGLAKDAYPSLDPSSSGVKAVQTWTVRTAIVANKWLSICWSPELGIFVSLAYDGTASNRIMTSPNGINWTTRTSIGNDVWRGICWSPELSLFVAVAEGGTIMTSPDGITWTGRPTPVDLVGKPNSVCWSRELGIFVAVCYRGNVITSNNGIAWISRTVPSNSGWYSVCWSPELCLFVAVAYDEIHRVMTSSNGIDWTARTPAIGGESNNWSNVCWSGKLGIFVAVGNGSTCSVMTSNNGLNWTARTGRPGLSGWWAISWSDELGIFVAVANGGTNPIMTSIDGINWTTRTSVSNGWWAICWSPELGIFAIVAGYPGSNGTNSVLTSSLKGRPPTSYNVFDSSFNSIDETGKWTFQNILTQQLTVNTTSYSSDDRVKHNEVIINNGLEVIDKLTPKFYQKTIDMLDASYNGDLSGYVWNYEAGLIAQEVIQVSDLSFAVSGGDYYEYVINYDLSNNDLSGVEPSKNLIKQVYGLNYNSIFVYGLAAIKELHAKVKAQEANTLDEQLNSLIARIETLES